MRGAWLVVLMIGCGFQSRPGGNSGSDGGAMPGDGFDATAICSSISNPQFHVAACGTPTSSSIDISTTISIDTDSGMSSLSGLGCAKDSADTCVLAAPSITIAATGKLAAHGSRPLALLAHSITLRGMVDVASHVGGAIGAGSYQSGCTAGMLPSGAGGGHGGGNGTAGADGGDEAGASNSHGLGSVSFVVGSLIGGCGGTMGGNGSSSGGSDGGITTGGAGGGAVWIVSDAAPLVIDDGAAINASGAGGAGGATEDHGGAGGGAGGLIVLQAKTITLNANARIFANGGGGGGGAGVNAGTPDTTVGSPGTDPTGPTSGGGGGAGGIDGPSVALSAPAQSGNGGAGYPDTAKGQDGGSVSGRGGGGGGGGAGAIRVVSSTDIPGPNVSPPPVRLPE